METIFFLISICELCKKYALCGLMTNFDDKQLALSLQSLMRGRLLVVLRGKCQGMHRTQDFCLGASLSN